MRARAVGEHHAVGDLAGKRDHLLAQRGEDDRRQRADAVMGAQLLNEVADVAERLARRHAHAHVRRRVTDADAETEAPPETSCMKAALCAKSPTVRA